MKLIEILNDSNLKNKFNEVRILDFYKYVSAQYVKTRRFASKIISMFNRSYQCEQIFLLMNSNKSVRSKFTDPHLNSVQKTASSNKILPK